MPISDHSSQNETQKSTATNTSTSALIYQMNLKWAEKQFSLPSQTEYLEITRKLYIRNETKYYEASSLDKKNDLCILGVFKHI